MEQQVEKRQVFPLWAILIGAFLGGPLAVGYLVANNFKVLGESEKTKPSLLIAVLSTIFFIVIAIALNIPAGLLGFFCVGVSFAIFQYYQKIKVETFIQAGGQVFGWGRVVGISLLSLLITFLPMLIWTAIAYNDADTQIQTYGTAVENQIAFRKGNLTKAEVDYVAAALEEVFFFDEAVPKNLYLEKKESEYIFSIFVQQQIIDSEEVGQLFEDLKIELSEVLPKHQITIHLVVDEVENIQKTY